MSAAVWKEPAARHEPAGWNGSRVPRDGRGDARRSADGGRDIGVLTKIVPAPRRPAGERLPRGGEPSPAETA
jgi:hypothetical protein